MKPEDQLIDALLKEQARKREADEELLASIDKALDAEDGRHSGRGSSWRRALPLAVAAGVALGGAVIYQQFHDDMPQEAIGMGPMPGEPTTTGVPAETAPFEMAAMEAPETGREARSESAPAAPAGAALRERPETHAAPAGSPSPTAPPAPATRMQAETGEIQRKEEARKSMAFTIEDQKAEPMALEVAPVEETDAAEVDALPPELAAGTLSRDELRKDRSVFGRMPRPLGDPVPDAEPRPESGAIGESLSRENYGQLTDQPWKSPWHDPQSTFSIDVDTASYTNLRRMIREGRPIQPDAVRIEELVNYFDYRYPAPEGDSPFAVGSLLATCPWHPEHLLARVAIKGREIDTNARPASNLVFLIDVSGSMQSPDKLPMLKRAMTTLVGSLDERDRVGIVVYAGSEGVVLVPTELTEEGKSEALKAIGRLESGGSTNGGAGLSRAYQMALDGRVEGGVNRVILATDGDFNVGTTGQGQLVELVKGNASKGVSLSVLGFGTGNLNDAMLEAITNHGDGNYFYVDGDQEAERVFRQKLTGTLVTIAKDVKIQVEFNPGKVKAYRLIGYANRVLRNRDFNDDKVDAGDIGAGHTVTAFYEIVPVGVDSLSLGGVDELKYQRPADRRELVESDEWFTLKLRYKHPEGETSRLITTPVTGEPVPWNQAGEDFRMASAVALFGMKLRGMEEVADVGWGTVRAIAEPALKDDREERRAGFVELVKELE